MTDPPVPMPPSLRVVRVAVTLLAVTFVAALAAGLLGRMPERIGYVVGGQRVTRLEWLRTAAPLFFTSAVWFGAGAVGLWMRRRWSRICIIGAFGTVCGYALMGSLNGSIPAGLGMRALIQGAIAGAVTEIYLYHTGAVSRYYDALRGRR
jgi:hypothetical protein